MSTGFIARRFARSSTTIQQGLRSSTKIASQQQHLLGSLRYASYFTPAHEYIKVEGTIGTCGITDFAQSALGDIVFVDLPEVGDDFDQGDSFGSVESVKAASDVYAPVAGTVTAINDTLTEEPGMVNSEAEEGAWFIKMEISDESQLSGLMNEEDYKTHCENEA